MALLIGQLPSSNFSSVGQEAERRKWMLKRFSVRMWQYFVSVLLLRSKQNTLTKYFDKRSMPAYAAGPFDCFHPVFHIKTAV